MRYIIRTAKEFMGRAIEVSRLISAPPVVSHYQEEIPMEEVHPTAKGIPAPNKSRHRNGILFGGIPPSPEAISRTNVISQAVKRTQEGEMGAFGEVYELMRDRIYKFVGNRLNREEDVEDVAATIFLKAFEHIDQYHQRESAPFGAWLFRIARNEVVSFIRTKKYKKEFTTNSSFEHIKQYNDIDEIFESEHEVDPMDHLWLIEGIESLPEAQRQVVHSRFIEGMNITQTAAHLGKKETNVKVLQHKGVKKLIDMYRRRLEVS